MIHNLWLIIDSSMVLQKLSLYSMLINLEPVRTSLNWFLLKMVVEMKFLRSSRSKLKWADLSFTWRPPTFLWPDIGGEMTKFGEHFLGKGKQKLKNQAPIVSFSHVPVVLFKPWLIGDSGNSWETESWAPPHDVLLSGTAVTASYMMLIEPKVILQNPKTMKIHATRVFNWNLKIVISWFSWTAQSYQSQVGTSSGWPRVLLISVSIGSVRHSKIRQWNKLKWDLLSCTVYDKNIKASRENNHQISRRYLSTQSKENFQISDWDNNDVDNKHCDCCESIMKKVWNISWISVWKSVQENWFSKDETK